MIRGIAVIVVLAASPALAQGTAQIEANKQVVFEFYKYWPADPEKAASLFTEDHVEHAPRFVKYCSGRGIKGKTCFLETIRSGAFGNLGRGGGRAGGAPGAGRAGGGFPPRTPDLVIAEKDLVTFLFKRRVPDPETPGAMYEAWSFDTYRIRDGKIAEHWDSATLNPPPGAPPVQR